MCAYFRQAGLDAITVVTVDNATAGTTGVDGKTTTTTDNHPSVATAVQQPVVTLSIRLSLCHSNSNTGMNAAKLLIERRISRRTLAP